MKDNWDSSYRILDFWLESEEKDGKRLRFFCYKLEVTDRKSGKAHVFYKVVRFIRVVRIPKGAKQSTSLMDMQSQILTGAYDRRINLVTVIANMIRPVPVGLLFLYGVQCTSEDIQEAKKALLE